jgi:hypothetical protein
MALAYFGEGTSCQSRRDDAALPLSRRNGSSNNTLAGVLISAGIDYQHDYVFGGLPAQWAANGGLGKAQWRTYGSR